MDCAAAKNLLDACSDAELDAVTAAEVQKHVEACAACREKLAAIEAVRAALGNPFLYERAPAGLREKIRRDLGVRKPVIPSWAMALAACLLVAAASIWIAATRITAGRDDAQVAEVLSAHLRSLQGDHLMDVISTDQHTVKPWFAGRLEFSPPVVDLADKGYPLAGGRLDALSGHMAAGLIYRHRLHVINVFVEPPDAPQPDEALSRQNYNIVRFRLGGMTCWAVSDLNMAELREFTQDLQAIQR